MPDEPKEYDGKEFERTDENGATKTISLKWKIDTPDVRDTVQLQCDFGDRPTLVDDWKMKLEGNIDPEAFLKLIISPEIVEM